MPALCTSLSRGEQSLPAGACRSILRAVQFQEPQYDLPRTGRWAGEVGASVLQALLRPIVQQAVAVTAPVAALAAEAALVRVGPSAFVESRCSVILD